MELSGIATPRPLYARKRDPVTILQEAEWALRQIWPCGENFFPVRTRSRDHPACSGSPYRLHYLPLELVYLQNFFFLQFTPKFDYSHPL